MNYFEVFPGSSILVRDKIPPSSILVLGPPGIGKTIFSKQFIVNGVLEEDKCIYVSTDESPVDFINSFDMFGVKEQIGEKCNLVDCYSWKIGRSLTEAYPRDHNELANISKCIETLHKSDGKIRFVLDSVTGLTSTNDGSLALKFVQVLSGRVKSLGGIGIFIVTANAHDEAFLYNLRRSLDGTIEMRAQETKAEITRLIRIFSLRGTRHRTIWTPFEITDEGITVKTDTALRCVLCSKPINWEPYEEEIDGKKYIFDKEECAEEYKKFKAIYGKYFE